MTNPDRSTAPMRICSDCDPAQEFAFVSGYVEGITKYIPLSDAEQAYYNLVRDKALLFK
jgi:hypothetical protein